MQIAEYKRFTIKLSDADTEKLDKAWKGASKHWSCTVYDKANRKQMSFNMFGGSMAKMSPLKTLYAYVYDAYTYSYFNDVEELMREYGYENYAEARNVYKSLEKAYYKCRKFIGSDNDILEIVNELGEEWG